LLLKSYLVFLVSLVVGDGKSYKHKQQYNIQHAHIIFVLTEMTTCIENVKLNFNRHVLNFQIPFLGQFAEVL